MCEILELQVLSSWDSLRGAMVCRASFDLVLATMQRRVLDDLPPLKNLTALEGGISN